MRSRSVTGTQSAVTFVLLAALLGLRGGGVIGSQAQAGDPILAAPKRAEGEGPFTRLILRGANLIDGTGAPLAGPVDIVIQGNRIARVAVVGVPRAPIDPARRPKAQPGDKEIDLAGHYVLPGFIDAHAHIGGRNQQTPAEYVYKLWMAHGVTTVMDPGSDNGLDVDGGEQAQERGKRDHRAAHPGVCALRPGARRPDRDARGSRAPGWRRRLTRAPTG